MLDIFFARGGSGIRELRISRSSSRDRECIHIRRRTPAHTRLCVFEIIGKIYRDRSNYGVITEIGPLRIIHGFLFYCE